MLHLSDHKDAKKTSGVQPNEHGLKQTNKQEKN